MPPPPLAINSWDSLAVFTPFVWPVFSLPFLLENWKIFLPTIISCTCFLFVLIPFSTNFFLNLKK